MAAILFALVVMLEVLAFTFVVNVLSAALALVTSDVILDMLELIKVLKIPESATNLLMMIKESALILVPKAASAAVALVTSAAKLLPKELLNEFSAFVALVISADKLLAIVVSALVALMTSAVILEIFELIKVLKIPESVTNLLMMIKESVLILVPKAVSALVALVTSAVMLDMLELINVLKIPEP